MNTPLGPNLCNVTCTCGHEADLLEFTQAPVAGEFSSGEFQCPKCRKAWRVVKTKIKITTWGTILSQPNKLEPIQSRL